jgi:putative transposase
MVRAVRIEFPGALYHLTSRGNEPKPIFRCEEDRRGPVSRLKESVQRYGIPLCAYLLVSHFFHR